jgi:hypothetical protein
LAQVVVPLWVLTGALFKAYYATPKNLPPTLFRPANEMGIDLMVMLWVIVAVELLAVGLMFLVPRVARGVAIFMLSCFILVLIAELVTGNFESCGCLGDLKFPPWAMLLVDGGLLIILLLSQPVAPRPATSGARWVAAAIWAAASVTISAVMILPADTSPDPLQQDEVVLGERQPKPLDSYYLPDCGTWEGKRWDELDIAQYMIQWPDDVDTGRRYVIFYGRTCDHCELLFELYFADPPVPTTIVAVPETKQGFQEGSGHADLCNGCQELEMPVGSDWVITTPIVVALEDGVVRCAVEGEDPEAPTCLIWH